MIKKILRSGKLYETCLGNSNFMKFKKKENSYNFIQISFHESMQRSNFGYNTLMSSECLLNFLFLLSTEPLLFFLMFNIMMRQIRSQGEKVFLLLTLKQLLKEPRREGILTVIFKTALKGSPVWR